MQRSSFPEGSLLDQEAQIHYFSTRLLGTARVHLSQLNRTWQPGSQEQGCELLCSHVGNLLATPGIPGRCLQRALGKWAEAVAMPMPIKIQLEFHVLLHFAEWLLGSQ